MLDNVPKYYGHFLAYQMNNGSILLGKVSPRGAFLLCAYLSLNNITDVEVYVEAFEPKSVKGKYLAGEISYHRHFKGKN